MPAAPMNPGFAELLEVAVERERQSVRIYRATAVSHAAAQRRVSRVGNSFSRWATFGRSQNTM